MFSELTSVSSVNNIQCEQTMDLVALVKESDASDYAGPIHAFTSMCIGLCKNPPPAKQKLPFLNKVGCRCGINPIFQLPHTDELFLVLSFVC